MRGYGQSGIIVNMAPVDGVDITPDNIFNFQIQSKLAGANNAVIKGTLRFRNSNLQMSYTLNYTIHQGINTPGTEQINPQWQFSTTALRNLFMTYKRLPAGVYEYCVSVMPIAKTGSDARTNALAEECAYHQSDEVFLINLIDPDNNAKIHEYNPPLSWVVNFPYASELTYRIRIAEIKQGQNPQNAVIRNNPVYDENNLQQNSIVYPAYAKPLQVNQPYAWSVNAYYKGILLGTSEFWKFTIIEDTLFKAGLVSQAYYEFVKHNSDTRLYAAGTLKLEYNSDVPKDTLICVLKDDHNNVIKFPQSRIPLLAGENRIDIAFDSTLNLKDNKSYQLQVSTKANKTYSIPFTYLNPLYLKN